MLIAENTPFYLVFASIIISPEADLVSSFLFFFDISFYLSFSIFSVVFLDADVLSFEFEIQCMVTTRR